MPPDAPASLPVQQREHVWHAYHALALLPTIGMLGGLPFANRVYPMVLGLPFLMAWLVGWVVATSAIMAFILRLDKARGLASDAVQGEGAENKS
ncbi:MAG: DUF3311 domain-containing protein [Gemmatimonadota bacterium]